MLSRVLEKREEKKKERSKKEGRGGEFMALREIKIWNPDMSHKGHLNHWPDGATGLVSLTFQLEDRWNVVK